MKSADVKFDQEGLIPAIVQDVRTGEVLTFAYMNQASFQLTVDRKETWFWSRSRGELWHKGDTSGNTQRVVSMALDCDKDAIVVRVEPAGPACHTGARSCFFNQIQHEGLEQHEIADDTANLGQVMEDLYALIESRKEAKPEGSYATYLFAQGLDKILKKLGEESSEVIIAAKNEGYEDVVRESSDLLYHLLVLLVERGVDLNLIRDELISRRKPVK